MIKQPENEKQFVFPEADFDWHEKEKIRSEINTNYGKYENAPFCVHISYGLDENCYAYFFENHGFDNINIYARTLVF